MKKDFVCTKCGHGERFHCANGKGACIASTFENTPCPCDSFGAPDAAIIEDLAERLDVVNKLKDPYLAGFHLGVTKGIASLQIVDPEARARAIELVHATYEAHRRRQWSAPKQWKDDPDE